tara:strand:- start:2500 stop:3420 length:921 start_codon:yes stop_codon:yes gene_type:complete
MKKLILPFILLASFACSSQKNDEDAIEKPREVYQPSKAFTDYWYAGTAELNHYKLSQARYGEMRDGDAVLIFVTEDFLTKKQVKNEGSDSKNSTTVLKTNYIKKFNTGIYDYSIMSSIFTPIDKNNYPRTFKVTTSTQEWCGQTYLQLNQSKNRYNYAGYSYFMNEGDDKGAVENVLLEDELFNRIRIDYTNIPTGEVRLLPATQWMRLTHKKLKPHSAAITLAELETNKMELAITYSKLDRIVTIQFEKNSPFRILEWSETAMSGFGESAQKLTTVASLDTTILSPYWNKNKNSDLYMRELLNLK